MPVYAKKLCVKNSGRWARRSTSRDRSSAALYGFGASEVHLPGETKQDKIRPHRCAAPGPREVFSFTRPQLISSLYLFFFSLPLSLVPENLKS
jgi:hypothetical protein